MLWTSIAVLAHYSVARLFNRNVNRTQMLYRYLFSSLAAAAVLTIATTASMYWWKVGHHKNGYQLVHGVCAVSGSGNVVITCCEGLVEVYMLLVIMRLAQKAEANHSAAVVWRHQRVSRGYIFIALLQA